MANPTLERVYTKLERAIKLNFSKPFVIDAVIKTVNNNKTFVVESGGKTILCKSKSDLSNLKEGMMIRLQGYLRINLNSDDEPMFSITVLYFYEMDEADIYSRKINIYNKLKEVIPREKCKKIIQRHYDQETPNYINNVGLIVCTKNQTSCNNFINSFKEKCVGRLFIYHIENKIDDTSFPSAIEYFTKYHNINLVCILSEKIDTMNSLLLSSKSNFGYLLMRKHTPYIVSVVGESDITPLSAIITNRTFEGIDPCIQFISKLQTDFKNVLETNINTGMQTLHGIVDMYKQKMVQMEIAVSSMNDLRFPKRIDLNDTFDCLKMAALKKLNKERILLTNIEALLMKKVIEDPILKKIYTEYIEKMRQKQQEENKKIEKNEKIENKTVDNTIINTKPNIIIERQNGEF